MTLSHVSGQGADLASLVMATYILDDRDDDGGVGRAVLGFGHLLEACVKIVG
jgi:hypothetical protein